MTAASLDDSMLDDVPALEAADPGQMLRALASSAAQVRAAATAAHDIGVAALAADGRPRAVVVTGMGGSAIAGDVLAALAGPACPVPVVVHRGYGLPGWVGAADLVVAVSCSGTTAETLSASDEAARRGCPLLAVGCSGSPLADRVERARGAFVPVPVGHSPRASLWSLATPLVVAGDALGLLSAPPHTIEATAVRLESLAIRCGPTSESFLNPGKDLAVQFVGRLPMAWGTSPVGGVAAYRLACQWAENAKLPAISGVLPEANHNAVMAFDGPWAGSADDIFRDRVDTAAPSLRLVLLRDPAEDERVAARADASRELASDRGVAVTEVVAEGESAYERLASLVGVIDYASVYLALRSGVDPSPIGAIDALKTRIRRP